MIVRQMTFPFLFSYIAFLALIPYTASRVAAQSTVQDNLDLTQIDELVNQAIIDGEMAGAVVCLASSRKTYYLEAFGWQQVEPIKIDMQVDSIFDLASLTKPIVTAICVAILKQRKLVDESDRVAQHLPDFLSSGKYAITVEQLLLHTSGLIADNALQDYRDGREQAYHRIDQLTLQSTPGSNFVYSDVNFIVLGELVESVSGQRLDDFFRNNVTSKLTLHDTTFNPSGTLISRCAATEQVNGTYLTGTVHDPRARLMDGVAGHAGLFSTAPDLVRIAQSLLADDGSLLEVGTIAWMTSPHGVPVIRDSTATTALRAYGWDIQSPFSINRGHHLSPQAFGHGGFTGTVLWIDPELDLIYIFLSNRLHPDGKGAVNSLAGKILDTVLAAKKD